MDKVYDEPVDADYQSVLLENDYVRLEMLPEIGGRIFTGQDKTNNNYDFFYRQDVIKPALVGLAGPWISGGVEFNWPQHHRPGTFMPADVHIEDEADGARTVWMSEHDPLNRLKGMHGIRLRPGSSLIELRARLYNRTPQVQTFLWWANIAAMVHDDYQSFFPTDVHYVADHAVRAMSSFPIANNPYYDIKYQDRPGANDLGWYKNIPVPTSYMVCQTREAFFGGYDHQANGGFVHVANQHISPGKKQWTWGNDAFGWAWDRELTDDNGPYVELMAGVYTDNQPDFTYLQPYETKTFTQYWWPIQNIGPVQQANKDAALACEVGDDGCVYLGLCVSSLLVGVLNIKNKGSVIQQANIKLEPGESWQGKWDCVLEFQTDLTVELYDGDGKLVLSYTAVDTDSLTRDREEATEPPAPEEIESADTLYLTGEHLEQYRHPSRDPESYWEEALKRDSGDARCNTAMGRRAMSRGEFAQALEYFEAAVSRLTHRHPNPVTGEAHYHLGLTRRWLKDEVGAYAAFYKATWNYEWRSASYYQLATIDCQRGDFSTALDHLEDSLDTNRQNNKAQVLKAIVLKRLGQEGEFHLTLDTLLQLDPLDHWAAYVRSGVIPDSCRNDAQTILDLVFDFCEAGLYSQAIGLIEKHHAGEVVPVSVPNPLERAPMTHYTLEWLKVITREAGSDRVAEIAETLSGLSADRFFPSRLEEMMILEELSKRFPQDSAISYALGNFYFDKRRHADAIQVWERAVDVATDIPQVYRNLGIAYWNHQSDGEKADAAYQKAMALDPSDARIVCEYDQLASKRNRPLDERLRFFEAHRDLVTQRDDATVSLASLYNLTSHPEKALDLVTSRRFHPWEGGEGIVLRQYTTAHLLLGQEALEKDSPRKAYEHFLLAMDTPESLGEAYHPLQAKADVNYWTGKALLALGKKEEALDYFTKCVVESGDFSGMAVTEHSPLSYYRALALRELGRHDDACALLADMRDFAEKQIRTKATIDYFATSLPNLLVFEEDLQVRQNADAHCLLALAFHGLGEPEKSGRHLDLTLALDQGNFHGQNLNTAIASSILAKEGRTTPQAIPE